MQSTRWSLGAVLAALFVFAPSTAAHAQTVAPGTRVRVHSSQVVAPITGSYQGMRRDTVLVIEDGVGARVWTFTSPAVDRLEVSAGMKPGNRGPTVRWALLGAGVGAAAGWAVALIAEAASSNQQYNDILSAAIGAGAGAALGGAYGYRALEEHWTAVPLPGRVGLAPTRTGIRVGFSTSF
jgi:hypothetical protein